MSYTPFNNIAKSLKKPFKGFDIISNKGVSNNPNDYRLTQFQRQFADDHAFPISVIVPTLRETISLLKERTKISLDKQTESDKKLEEKPHVEVFPNHKHIKSLKIINNRENVFEYSPENVDDKEAIVKRVAELMNEVNHQINNQLSHIHDKLMLNSIDLDKNSNSMLLIKEGKLVEVTGQIKAKQLKEYLFLISGEWVRNPIVQKSVKVKATHESYVLTYENQKYTLTKENGEFSELEKEMIQELKSIFPIA